MRRSFRSRYNPVLIQGMRRFMFPFRPWLLLLLLYVFLVAYPAVARDAATVTRVVDGDTLEITLKGKTEKVRLIGVDTPETFESDKLRRDVERTGQDKATIKALGQRASEFTKGLVHAGDSVELEYGQEPRDRYRRLLAFVWLSDGRMLNETIICEGYANALTRYPFRSDYMERFRACERTAREQGKGLWSTGAVEPSPAPSPSSAPSATLIKGNRNSKVYHLPGCPGYNRSKPENVVIFATEQDARQGGYRKAKNCPKPQ